MAVLAVQEDQEFWTDEQIAVLRQLKLEDATKADFYLFLAYAQRTGLDPFSKQIYMIGRWSSKEQRKVYTIQTSIDGLRVVAQRSKQYAGQTPPSWCGPDGIWVDAWLDVNRPPAAAKVGVHRIGFAEPLYAVARYASYCPMRNDKPDGQWGQMPDVMLSKVAEALALRKAFPHDLSGLYTDDEMDQADVEQVRSIGAGTGPDEETHPTEAKVVEKPGKKSKWTDEQMIGAVGAIATVKDPDRPHTTDSLREIWTTFGDVLDMPVDGSTLREAIFARKQMLETELPADDSASPEPAEQAVA